MSASSPALTLASTLQSASLNRHPSPHHDLNPSTSASQKRPIIRPGPTSRSHSASSSRSSIPLEALKPVPRSTALPPLPDLRFEQSYLASLRGCQGVWGVLGVTVRDQVGFLFLLWFFGGVGGRGNAGCGLIGMVVFRFCCRLCRGCYGRWRCRGGGIGIRVRSSRGRVWGAG